MPATHVALLRGINVGKAKRIAMADLRAIVTSLGATDVKTLLNSGNVVFTARRAIASTTLQTAIRAGTGVDARTTVLTAGELSVIMRENPLLDVATDPTRLVVYVPADASTLTAFATLLVTDWSPDVLKLGCRAAYVWSPEGLLAGTLFERVNKRFKDAVTARNWATMTKLHALVGA